jgi:long-chain acyl-CoA synthetase
MQVEHRGPGRSGLGAFGEDQGGAEFAVTSGGKNIAPQPIENAIKSHNLVAEIVMIGNKRNFPAALIVPNFANLEKWAGEQDIPFASREDLVTEPRVIDLYDRTVKELTKDQAQYERIKKIVLLSREFSIETGELTPKLSVKRRVVEEKYKGLIDRIYEGA